MLDDQLLDEIYNKLAKNDHNKFDERFDFAKKEFGLKYLPYTPKQLVKSVLASKQANLSTMVHRTIIPIFDENDILCGLSGRKKDDNKSRENKYYNFLLKKQSCLYHVRKFRPQNFILVVEGFVDVMRIHHELHLPVVATMGTTISEKQIEILNNYGLPVHLMYDGDNAGKEGMLKIPYSQLKVPIFVRKLEYDYDPDDWVKTGFILPEPIPYETWYIKTRSRENKKRFYQDILIKSDVFFEKMVSSSETRKILDQL